MVEENDNDSPNLSIYLEKNRGFRTIYSSGAFVSLTPQLNVQFTPFSDLAPLPDVTMHSIVKGHIGEPIQTMKKEGMIREVDVSILMSLETVQNVINSLQTVLNQAQEAIALQQTQQTHSQE